MRCRLCRDDIDHCHGTLIISELEVVCSDPDCVELDVERHDIVVDAVWELRDRRDVRKAS